jgi:hypothetical protein
MDSKSQTGSAPRLRIVVDWRFVLAVAVLVAVLLLLR